MSLGTIRIRETRETQLCRNTGGGRNDVTQKGLGEFLLVTTQILLHEKTTWIPKVEKKNHRRAERRGGGKVQGKRGLRGGNLGGDLVEHKDTTIIQQRLLQKKKLTWRKGQKKGKSSNLKGVKRGSVCQRSQKSSRKERVVALICKKKK